MMIDIVGGQHARQQLLALAMSSHPRCGANSPARNFMSLSPLATSPLWEWCLQLTEVVFGALAMTSLDDDTCETMLLFTFGVSLPLRSVTRPTKLIQSWSWPTPIVDAIPTIEVCDPAHVVMEAPGAVPNTKSFSLINAVTKQQRLLFTRDSGRGLACSVQNCNQKWWLKTTIGSVLAVANLVDSGSSTVECDTRVPVYHLSDGELGLCTLISFNNSIPDEALLLVECEWVDFNLFIVIDIRRTYSTGHLSVVSSKKWVPLFEMLGGKNQPSALYMPKHSTADTQQRYLFLVLDVGPRSRGIVYRVDDTSDTLRGISTQAQQLSQLSSILFCISKIDGSVEVWDCNHTEAPLRVLLAQSHNAELDYSQVDSSRTALMNMTRSWRILMCVYRFMNL
ncbi:hypothetical protein Pelo_3685 [Pelomyxa schiedti]|nr:hypothetical protein Pelo_3685 [Pelomyxa schiedti]